LQHPPDLDPKIRPAQIEFGRGARALPFQTGQERLQNPSRTLVRLRSAKRRVRPKLGQSGSQSRRIGTKLGKADADRRIGDQQVSEGGARCGGP
jgi:hypothetical protein